MCNDTKTMSKDESSADTEKKPLFSPMYTSLEEFDKDFFDEDAGPLEL